MQEKLAIAGSGTIAAGLASVAAAHGDVLLWARSDASADRVRRRVAKHCDKLPALNGCADRVQVVSELEALPQATFLVEAVVEDPEHKGPLLAELASYTGPDEILATTTSSLSIAELAQASGHPDRFVGLHVFNPVPRMELIELAYGPRPATTSAERTPRAVRAARQDAGRGARHARVRRQPAAVPVPVLRRRPDGGERHGARPTSTSCMTLGAGMPMGPIALLDFVGLDVSQAIGETIGADGAGAAAASSSQSGALGRKSRRGFYVYD